MAGEFLFDGQRIALDERGYLCELSDWSESLAVAMAAADGIALTPNHWDVIRLLREHHTQFRLSPPMRLLVRLLARQWDAQQANSRYLYRLFPDGPARQASRYAGLPRPVSCI